MANGAAAWDVRVPDSFDAWRAAARRLIMAGCPPERIIWSEANTAGDLLARPLDPLTLPGAGPAPRAPRAFVALAEKAFLHSDPQRHALLYRLLWKVQAHPGALADAADPDVRRLEDLARAVRRDIHKMRAFVRFRSVRDDQGAEWLVAWFEPLYTILRANAAFFVNRFATMNWAILTPQGTLHWDGTTLHEGPPARREDAPGADPAEDLWRTYYASIFNPARLKVRAMLKEMPKRYWKNMPETALIGGLIAGAQAREAGMVARGEDAFAGMTRPATLSALAAGLDQCRRCPIGCNGTRAVPGEGPSRAALMVVGEQPGDCEEDAGRPFVGPAGAVLDQALERAGLIRADAYLTNAVKHFKYTPRGKRRLHQNPAASEIDLCRWWLDSERQLVAPRLILTLGASALRGVTGRSASLQAARTAPRVLQDGTEVWSTVHPSYLLRLDGAAAAREAELFAGDLARLAERVAALGVEA